MPKLKPWEITLCVMVALFLAVALFHSPISKSQTPCANGLPVDAVNGATACGTWPPVVMGSVNSRTISLATAYQATDPTKLASTNINLTSTATVSLTGGTTNAATVYIGSTNGVATGTGTPICSYANSNTGTLTLGLNLSTISTVPCHFDLPIGWYFAVVLGTGTVSIASAFEQSVG